MLWQVPVLIALWILTSFASAEAAEAAKPEQKYFAHPSVEDQYGVVAPWYHGQNGQCDFRVRIAAETLKRYPWAEKSIAVMPGPHFVFNGHWSIKADGTILVNPKLGDWDNGDVGQRSMALLFGMTDYYRYTGDPAAIGIVTMTADYVLDYCQTAADHPWPGFFISCPTNGKAYGRADPHGFIQLDISAWVGSGMVRAYKLTGNPRYLEAAKHWADLLAEHCDASEGARPWNRYANPEDAKFADTKQTGGVVLVLRFLDDLIRLGYRGKHDALPKARDVGDRYLRDVLLPQWSSDPTFGHHFWDWLNPTATCSLSGIVAEYMMDRPEAFPNWKNDARNIMSLFLCRSSVDPASAGGIYSGAWAFPESSGCCGKSLQYPVLVMTGALARYGEQADSAWARELARRQTILCTYDAHESGVVEDRIDGGIEVAGIWFNLSHPAPLAWVLNMIAWQPEFFGANRENHIMRTSSVVNAVRYGKGRVAYTTYDAPSPTVDVLRLAFTPRRVSADGKSLKVADQTLQENGYAIRPLQNGDCIVTIRHDGCRQVVVEGDDPQQFVEEDRLQLVGDWAVEASPNASGGELRVASQAGAEASFAFEGNQVRLIGRASPHGGKADVYLDGVKQLCGIDCWSPDTRDEQVLFYKNGLRGGKHELRVAVIGTKNPYAQTAQVALDGLQWSAAEGESGFGEGQGPKNPQRVIFGYVGRNDYVDSQGSSWRPATEFILRMHKGADLVPLAFETEPQLKDVAATADPELYRYGVHGPDLTAFFTVAPTETYHVRLKFCQAEASPRPAESAICIELQDEQVVTDMDVAATAGGPARAVDLVFNDVRPKHGMISIRLWNNHSGQATIQAIEVAAGPGGQGAKPVRYANPLGAR